MKSQKDIYVKKSDENRDHKGEAGYSLLEILIALAIIATLTVIVGPRLTGHVDKSKIVATQSQVKQLRSSLGLMQMDIGRYPTKDEGLSMLVSPVGNVRLWSGPYIDGDVPLDAWGQPFIYEPPMSGSLLDGPSIVSLGADGEPGGEGLNADIGR